MGVLISYLSLSSWQTLDKLTALDLKIVNSANGNNTCNLNYTLEWWHSHEVMFLRTIRQVWRSIQTRNTISALVCVHRFLKGAGHSTPNLMQNQSTLCPGCFGMNSEISSFFQFSLTLCLLAIRYDYLTVTSENHHARLSALTVLQLCTFYLMFAAKSSSSTKFFSYLYEWAIFPAQGTYPFCAICHFRGEIFSSIKDLRSSAAANKNYSSSGNLMSKHDAQRRHR